MKIRTKIILIFSLGATLMAGFLYAFWIPAENQREKMTQEMVLHREMKVIAETLIPLMLKQEYATLHEYMESVSHAYPYWSAVMVRDANGRRIFPLSEPVIASGESFVRHHHEITFRDSQFGVIDVTADFSNFIKIRTSKSIEFATIMLLTLLAIMGVVIFLLEISVIRPVSQLANASSSVADGSFEGDEFISAPRTDEVGHLISAFIAMRDSIIERRNAEQDAFDRLKESKASLDDAQRLSNIGSYAWDIKDNTITWSDEHYRIYELDPQSAEVDLDLFLSRIHPDDVEKVTNALKLSVETGIQLDVRYRLQMKDGAIKYINSIGEVNFDDHGNALSMMGTIHDVTAKTHADIALRVSRERLNHLLTTSPAVIYTLRPDGDFGATYISPNVTEQMGFEPDDFTNDSSFWANGIHPDDRERVFDNLAKLFGHGHHQHEYRFRRPEGGYRWVNDELRLIYDGKGKPTEIIGAWSDITARKEAEERMEAARAEAENANKAKSEFLSSMSHELRTPLNGILGYAQLMQMDPRVPLPEQHFESTKHIMKSGQHLLDLIDQVLELAKIEAGQYSVSIETIPMCALLEECVDTVSRMADKKNITIAGNGLDCVKVNVRADRTRLRQAILNLLSNAVKYNREGGSVTLSFNEQASGKIRINVSDTGYGIPENKKALVFEPFNRLGRESSTIEGTGIGLTITRELLWLMDGDIGFESEEGKGTTFWLEIPMSEETAEDVAPVQAEEDNKCLPNTIGDPSRSYSVLYIEDSQPNITLMERVFEQTDNIELFSAHDAEQGIKVAQEMMPDIILMDINLPGMDGIEATKILRQTGKTCDIPIIAVSAAAMSHEVERGKEAGFSAYLTKPIKIDELLGTMARAMHDDKTSA